jgi:TonB family protein
MNYRIAFVALTALGLLAKSGAAQSAPPAVPMWISAPAPADIADLYPDRAQRMEKAGEATVSCAIQATGRLGDCAILDESPPGWDFGYAAIKIATYRYRISTVDKHGKDIVGRRMILPVTFQLGSSIGVPLAPTLDQAAAQTPNGAPATGSTPGTPPSSQPPLPAVRPPSMTAPSKAQLIALRPPSARHLLMTAHTQVRCTVLSTGLLTDCKLMAEDPAGFGFGAAAMKATAYYRVNLDDSNRASLTGRYCILAISWSPLADPIAPAANAGTLAPNQAPVRP